MSVVAYRCTVCSRVAELIENPLGLDRIDRCTITHHCSGRLVQQSKKPEYSVGKPAAPILGLNDWLQRVVFYEHKQLLAKSVWTVYHNLGSNPSIQAFIKTGARQLVEADPDTYTIKFINKNIITVDFGTTNTGSIHCVARDSSAKDNNTVVADQLTRQVTTSYSRPSAALGQVSLTFKHSLTYGINSDNVRIAVIYGSSNESTLTRFYNAGADGAAWSTVSKVSFAQQTYTTFSYDLALPYFSTAGSVDDGSQVFFAGFAFQVVATSLNDNTFTLAGDQTWRFTSGYKFTYTESSTTVPRTVIVDTAIKQADPSVLSGVSTTIKLIGGITFADNIIIPFAPAECFILFANAPYQSPDREIQSVVPLNLTRQKSFNSIAVQDGQLVVVQKLVTKVYPDIQVINGHN